MFRQQLNLFALVSPAFAYCFCFHVILLHKQNRVIHIMNLNFIKYIQLFVWSKCGGSLVCRVSRSLEIQRKTHLYLLFRDVILVQRPFHTNCTLLNQIHLSHLKCIEPLISRCLHFFSFIFKWFFCRRCENTSR